MIIVPIKKTPDLYKGEPVSVHEAWLAMVYGSYIRVEHMQLHTHYYRISKDSFAFVEYIIELNFEKREDKNMWHISNGHIVDSKHVYYIMRPEDHFYYDEWCFTVGDLGFSQTLNCNIKILAITDDAVCVDPSGNELPEWVEQIDVLPIGPING